MRKVSNVVHIDCTSEWVCETPHNGSSPSLLFTKIRGGVLEDLFDIFQWNCGMTSEFRKISVIDYTLIQMERPNQNDCTLSMGPQIHWLTPIIRYSHTDARDETYITFYNELSPLVHRISKPNILIIGGDMNAQIGKDENNKFYSLNSNMNGEHLTEFLHETD